MSPQPDQRPGKRISRRRAIKVGVSGIAGLVGLGLYAHSVEPFWIRHTRRTLPIEKLPSRFDGKSLVQISDLHICSRIPERYLENAFAEIDALEPDIVAITGDFITWEDGIDSRIARVFPKLPRGKSATVAILGNHDYGPTWRDGRIADNIQNSLTSLSIQVLRNDVLDLDGLQFLGFDELWSGRCDIPGTLSSSDPNSARLALLHNPDGADRPGWNGFNGWILSGHTHGGQCKPPFLPPPIVPVQNKRYTSGHVSLSGGRQLYINRGLGYLRQVRFNARPEITRFTLARAD